MGHFVPLILRRIPYGTVDEECVVVAHESCEKNHVISLPS